MSTSLPTPPGDSPVLVARNSRTDREPDACQALASSTLLAASAWPVSASRFISANTSTASTAWAPVRHPGSKPATAARKPSRRVPNSMPTIIANTSSLRQ